MLGVSPRTIQSWVDNGMLDAWKTAGGHRRVTLASVERLKKEGQVLQRPVPPLPEKGGDIYLARQPILDRRQRIVAYELLYRGSALDRADIGDPVEASSRVITYAFSDLGVGAALGGADCHINVNQAMLMSDVVEILPHGNVTLEINNAIEISPEFVARCQQLRAGGIRLAAGGYVLGSAAKNLLPHVDTVKVPISGCDARCLEKTVKEIRAVSNVQLLAEKVESAERFRQCQEMGFDFFQGYYFARPHIVAGRRIPPARVVLFQLVNLIIGDAPNGDIENLLKGEPNLCYNLFRLVNSVAMGINRRISSVRDVITILGRRQLQRWAHLLLFAQQEDFPYPSPLLQTAALRGELMRKLAMMVALENPEIQEHAFIVGIMSLLDALLGIPMEEVLKNVNVVDDVYGALTSRQGVLGRLLVLCEGLEGNDLDALPALLDKLRLDTHYVMQAQVEALQWVNAIGESLHA
jgi:EAL and modified HD-GYP domain-containing signal transduction protein